MRMRSIFAGAGVFLLVGAALVGWREFSIRRAWAAMRPVAPAAVGARAPGLDQRLQDCAARLAQNVPDPAALQEFSLLCHANGALDAAIDGYRALAHFEPHDGRWPYLLAVIHAGYGRLHEALPLFERAVVLAPDHVPSWVRLGDARLKSDDPARAADAYEEALKRDPEHAFALLGLARCALREERWTAARGLLQRVVAADPRLAPAQHLLATVHERLGNADAAAAVLARASAASMQFEPEDTWIDALTLYCHDIYRLRITASAALAAGDNARAIAAGERALALAPDDSRVLAQLGTARAQAGQLVPARAHLERAVALDPEYAGALLDLIQVLQQTGDTAATAACREAYAARFGSTSP